MEATAAQAKAMGASAMKATRRISVVGMGRVGAAIAGALARGALATHLVLMDVVAARAESEALDLRDAMAVRHALSIEHCSDVAATAHSDVVFITAGARQRDGESRLQLLKRNVAILGSFVPQLVALSPTAIVVVVSNPVDVLTYVTARLAGDGDAAARVIGSGTNLDSARLTSALARRARVAAREVHAFVIGEHGDSSLAPWSIASVGGLPLRALSTDLEAAAARDELLAEVRGAAADIIRHKGYTATAVGESCADLARCVLSPRVSVRAVSTRVAAGTFAAVPHDVFLSLPVRLGVGAVGRPLVPQLDDDELELLRRSAAVLLDAQRDADVHLAPFLNHHTPA